jgi:hypothetical protein
VNLAACAALPRTPENKVWYRLVQPHRLSTALGSAHTRLKVSRFNAGHLQPAQEQFATFYLADDPIVGQFEAGAVLGSMAPGGYMPHPRLSFVCLNVHIILRDVVDLTEIAAAQVPLATTAQELTGDWRGYSERTKSSPLPHPTGIAPTQELGRAIFLTGIEGFRTISAKVPDHRIIVVLPENLQLGSSLVFSDPSGTIVHRIP